MTSKKAPEVAVEEIGEFSDDDATDAIKIISTLNTIAIYFCNAGTIVENLAKRMHNLSKCRSKSH